jgi:FMN phosphatase YigB (HAD superfamily)
MGISFPAPVRADLLDGPVPHGVLLLAIAFAAENVLAPTSSLPHDVALADVQERVRPAPGALRTLRELEGLGIGLALVGDGPEWLVRRIAQVVWFRGEAIATAGDRFAVVCERIGLPAPCIWYVTADPADAANAVAAGCNAVLIDPEATGVAGEPDDGGRYVVPAIDGVLEVIRVPYTRSALNLRYLLRKILDTPPVEDLVR